MFDCVVNFIVGGTMTTVLTAQFVLLSHLMKPGARPVRELIILPIMWGMLAGCAFGSWDCMTKTQVIHKPAMERYYDHMRP